MLDETSFDFSQSGSQQCSGVRKNWILEDEVELPMRNPEACPYGCLVGSMAYKILSGV